MRSDAERFRFLEEFTLSVTRTNEGASIYWRGADKPGQPGGFYSIAGGVSLEAAVDEAMDRWERQHRRKFAEKNH